MSLLDPFFYYGGNVLILRNSAVERMNHLQTRLREITGSCDFSYFVMTPLRECYTVLYINRLSEIIDAYILSGKWDPMIVFDHPSIITHITSQFQMIDFENHAEIYSVCTLPSERKKGNVRQMLSIITKKTTKKILWLGVVLENPMFENVVRLYALFGFSHPFLTNHSLSGHYSWDHKMLSLVFIKEEDPYGTEKDSKDALIVLNRALRLRKSYYLYMKHPNDYCLFSYRFTDPTLRFLEEQLREKLAEIGGSVRYISTSLIKDREPVANISIPLNEVVVGVGEPYYTVRPRLEGKNCMVFHTHPNIINMSERVFVTWPSSADMAYTLSSFFYHSIVCHMVATMEGIYTINLSHEFITYLSTYVGVNVPCISFFIEHIIKMFTPTEDFRSEGVVEREIKRVTCTSEQIQQNQCPENPLFREKYYREIFQNYFLKMNDATMSLFLKNYPNICVPPITEDFPLFEVDFFKWSDISALRTYYSQIMLPRKYMQYDICPTVDARPGDSYPS